MPNKRNAKKALRQTLKRAALNKVRRDAYKTAVKKAAKSTSTDAKELIRQAQKALDKAAKRGVIKKNTAARKLSRLMKQIKKKTVSA
jgi:small subunit ribosomal protein S20